MPVGEIQSCASDDHQRSARILGLLLLGASEDLIIAGFLHSVVANVRGVVPGGFQALGDYRRERVVDQEPHAEATSGSSRSRTASAA